MTSLVLAAALQTSLLSPGFDSYSEAHRKTTETGKPLVVLVGADWCPACRHVKQNSLPELQRRGALEQVAFAVVDTDRDGKIARQLMSGGPIPQLIMFYQTPTGWMQEVLIGSKSPGQIESFIARGLKGNTAAAPARSSNAAE